MDFAALKVVLAVTLCGYFVVTMSQPDLKSNLNYHMEKSCHNISTQVVSYFVNPSYPKRDTIGTLCDYRIDVTNENVCQIRLDFEIMSVLEPHRILGYCLRDRFMALTDLPNGIVLPELCGENSGQHMYIPINAATGTAYLSLLMMTSGNLPYHWRIRSTQIDCKLQTELVAPTGCLQYHYSLSGSIRSFNYADGKGHYQYNLDYAICIKRSLDTCRIKYRQAENSTFWINSAEGADLAEGIGRAGTASCDLSSHDYLLIIEGRGPTNAEDEKNDHIVDNQEGFSITTCDKFCGRSLSGLAVEEYAKRLKLGYVLDPQDNVSVASTVTSYVTGPIVLRFHSDSTVEADQEIGFHLKYQQLDTGCK